jgi:ABC-type dipeptide/oligopeptide/nickel transport system permease subunit
VSTDQVHYDGASGKEDVPDPLASGLGRGPRGFSRLVPREYKLLAGTILLAIVVLPVLLAPYLSSVGPSAENPAATFLAPSFAHLMGADQFGRSVLARVLYGGRYTLGASVAVVLLGGSVGSVLGLVAGYAQGPIGFAIMRCVDLLLAFPGILLALAVAAILGPSLQNAILAVSVVAVPIYARIVEGAARQARNLPYVKASRVLGGSSLHIIRWHIIPGAAPAIVVETTVYLGVAALWIAGLGFLGLGVQPPTPEWGQLVSSGQADLTLAWWNAVFPGAALAIYVISVTFIGDGLRDRLTPGEAGR